MYNKKLANIPLGYLVGTTPSIQIDPSMAGLDGYQYSSQLYPEICALAVVEGHPVMSVSVVAWSYHCHESAGRKTYLSD